jgi:hypothetical protein
MPNESAILSAKATSNMLVMMLNLGCVRVSKPVMIPKLVMIADVAPKLNLV